MSDDAYSKIKDKILEKARSEAAEITSEAEKKAEEIMKEAEMERNRIISEAREIAQSEASVERKRTVATSALKWKMKALNDQEEYIQKTFDFAFEELDKFTNSPNYPKTLTELAVDAGVGLGGGDMIAKVRERDLNLVNPIALADKISSQTGVSTTIQPIVEPKLARGGIILQKGSVWIDNTFDAIFNRKKRDIRTEVAKILFEN